MATGYIESNYFSGQGVLFLSERNPDGSPTGFRPVGNVSALNISINVTKQVHKEAQTGARATDKTIIQESEGTLNMTLENMNAENLALALYGTTGNVASGTVTDEDIVGSLGLWKPVNHIKVSSIVLTDSGGTTTYVEGENYQVNTETGMIYFMTAAEQTAAAAANSIADLDDLLIDYSYDTYDVVSALTSSSAPVRRARFDGLNTADSDNPVVIDIFKLETGPLAQLDLISDEIAGMELECSMLSDPLSTETSKYFKVSKVA